MFYSHQLLSKKHPMGQIWIAATIRANINRTKVAKINIEKICKQILYPPVPLALRLSGILMGGVVHIYNRKVYFLYEDLNAFLVKIKIEAARKAEDRTTLPKRKFRAKFENITMVDEFGISNSIERPMRQSSVPPQESGNTLEEMFFVFPDADNVNFDDNSSPRDHFQAAIEDITLQENVHYSPDSVGGLRKSGSSISADSILGPMDDFLPEFQLPGQSPVEDCLPVFPITENLPPDLAGALHTIFEEQLPEPEINQDNDVMPEAGSQPKRDTRARRKRKRNARKLMYDDDGTELSKNMFATWLQDRSNILSRVFESQIRKNKKQRVAAVQQTWTLPSVCVSLNMKFRPEPAWAPPLQEMWRLAISTASKPESWVKRAHSDARDGEPSSASEQNFPMETDFPVRTDVPTETDVPMQTDFPAGTDFPMETDMHMDPENSPPEVDLPASLGSVEKLREALQTPSTGSQDELFGKKFGLRTPGLFAPFSTGGKSSKRSMPTPQAGSLSYDSEGEPPTSGKSKGSRGSSVMGIRRSMSPVLGELPELKKSLPRRESGKSDMVDYFASGDFQAGILAQSQLLEDTDGSTQVLVPADSINTTTIVLAKLLREHFDKLKTADISEASLDKLTFRLDTTHAARMFYQVCVLASNESVTVTQAEPYGDILLKRGVTL